MHKIHTFSFNGEAVHVCLLGWSQLNPMALAV